MRGSLKTGEAKRRKKQVDSNCGQRYIKKHRLVSGSHKCLKIVRTEVEERTDERGGIEWQIRSNIQFQIQFTDDY